MKTKKILFSIFIVIAFTFLAGCDFSFGIGSIEGLIVDKSEDSFIIMNSNDTLYTINNKIEVPIGDYVNIKYFGKLDYLKNNNIDIRIVEIAENPFNNEIMKYVNSLSIEEKIGQLIVAKVPKMNKIETITDYHISGYIYFANDIGNKTIEEIQKEINIYQKNSKIPMFMAIDEEGGTVSRLSGNKKITEEGFKSPQELFYEGGFSKITEDAIRKRDLLVKLGFNVNYAPVVDVVTDENAYMYLRSFGKNAEQTAIFASQILNTQTKELTYTFKHFPGYGNNVDTHITKAKDNRSIKSFDDNDFVPYKSVINNGAKQIMISHNIVNKIDNKPSSLSVYMHNILRERLGFKGVIITDSLSMNAITKYESNPYVEAVKAGNNQLITNETSKTFNDIKEALQNGLITDELLSRLVYRVIELKMDKGLL